MSTLEETQAADKVRFLNDLALVAVLRDHPAILIRPQDLPSWRPCRQSCVGVLEGLEHLGTLVPLCTDGCVAWFQCITPSVHREAVGSESRFLGRDKSGAEVWLREETFVLFGHVASFVWGENRGAPPQPHSLPPPQEKKHTVSPFQNAKTGKWWYVDGKGKWNGPWETQELAQEAISASVKGGRCASGPRTPSALDAALDLLRNLPS